MHFSKRERRTKPNNTKATRSPLIQDQIKNEKKLVYPIFFLSFVKIYL